MHDDELDRFKRLDLIAFAATMGYAKDEQDSTPGSTVLRNGADKVIVKIDPDDGHWVYFSVRDLEDHGTILDFVQKRTGAGLGQVRKRIRESSDSFSYRPSCTSITPKTADDEGYRRKTAAVWAAAARIAAPAYLLSRGLSPAIMADPRFADTFRVDARGNVVFPHRDRIGLCGYELRREGNKAFAAGTKKGLWLTNNLRTASSILIVESAIDAMSHYQLHGGDSAYCSLAGTPSKLQKDLLIGLLIKADIRGAAVYSAVDNDRAGHELNDLIQQLTPVRRDRLTPVAGDWNQDLKDARRNRRGTAPAMRRSAA